VFAVEIAKGYYPAIAIDETEGPRRDERVAGEARGRKRSECGGRRGKEGEGCGEGEDGEVSGRTEASTATGEDADGQAGPS
jgi:hypothetical protein